ncbi:hypothetical protein PHYSODRAFT_312951 [Phytophthora sojae]|uniref:SET domain-containing protein n=1 Tax=Phytophthora sojae (strain P6497) TaxID=1094619 RepID=G4Z4H0_PHYSP|nr:hypothetical protein PHYSODRAFT_312951 [Phytophthora sojae]EGZ20174.1 hypothetical protein PHYSODRAFT_312951 [Phytophthora sojae]|eukprot:XP_009522891.1 hypothetical protein PHYSODRAFT_312951 [Phytophthora sojae]
MRLKQETLDTFLNPVEPEGVSRGYRFKKHCAGFEFIERNIGALQTSKWKKRKCQCTTECSSRCSNRLRRIECDESTCAFAQCQNRPWSSYAVRSPHLEVRRTLRMGRGVFALVKILKGDLIREFVGEKYSPCLYTMKYRVKHYIDAQEFGNKSRLFNHSCEPNSRAEEWTVAGNYRVGIVAGRDIQAGEEITFDYGSEYYFNECMCSVCCKVSN